MKLTWVVDWSMLQKFAKSRTGVKKWLWENLKLLVQTVKVFKYLIIKSTNESN